MGDLHSSKVTSSNAKYGASIGSECDPNIIR